MFSCLFATRLSRSARRIGGDGEFGEGDLLFLDDPQNVLLNPVAGELGLAGRFRDGVEVVGDVLALFDQHVGVIFGEAIVRFEPATAGGGEFADVGADGVEPGVIDLDGNEVGLGEVAVVGGGLLLALGFRFTFDVVPAPGLLGGVLDRLAIFLPLAVLAVGLELEGTFNGSEAVQVLDLDDRRGDGLAVFFDVEVDVGIAAERAFLHLAVGDAEVAEGEAQFFETSLGVLGGANVGLGDDLQEGDTRAVQVDLGEAAGAVGELAGVFFEVDAGQPAATAACAVLLRGDLKPAAPAEGEIILADLIILRKVGIIVILAVPLGEAGDIGAAGPGRS